MKKNLDSIRAAFKSNERDPNAAPAYTSNYYPFWNMETDESCTVRFLPDANEDNPTGFLLEKVMHNLVINGEKKSVPCLSMYGEDCPICKVSQQYYKTEGKDSPNGKKYWKKKQHLAQILVVNDPLPADVDTGETHEGKGRVIALGFQIYNIIKAAFEDGELDDVPFAYEGGTDFIIKKTKQGDYAGYTIGTKFARKPSNLDEDVVANLELVDLSTLLPKHPGTEKVEAMLAAAMTGSEYADDDHSSAATDAPATKAVTKPSATTAQKKAEPTPDVDSELDQDAEDILADIRKRRAAKNEG